MSVDDGAAANLAAEGTRRGVVVLNRDAFFGIRIGNVLRALGYDVTFVKDAATFSERCRAADHAPFIGVVDINADVDWSEIGAFTVDPTTTTPLLAFGSHLDIAGRRAAKTAGVRRVVTNGEFHQNMVELVGRYGRDSASTADIDPSVGGQNG
ncbi:MAG: hypothetical protein ACR2OO_08135 [Thermomicrobiales bacterium]